MTSIRAVALVLVWSSGFIGAELGARAAPPMTVLTWRFLAIAVVLLPWLRQAARLDRREWGRQAVLALLCQCLYLAGVVGAAAAGVPAGTSALVASLQPAVVLIAVVLLGGGRLRPGHVAGLVLGTGGVALTTAGDLNAGVGVAALALPLAAMLSLAAGTLLQQRWRSSAPLMPSLAIQAAFGVAFFTPVAAATGDLTPLPTAQFWTAIGWAAAAGLGSYGLYYLVAIRDGATRASALLYLTPAATALWAAPMSGQPLRPAAVVGLLVSGAAVVVLGAARTRVGGAGNVAAQVGEMRGRGREWDGRKCHDSGAGGSRRRASSSSSRSPVSSAAWSWPASSLRQRSVPEYCPTRSTARSTALPPPSTTA